MKSSPRISSALPYSLCWNCCDMLCMHCVLFSLFLNCLPLTFFNHYLPRFETYDAFLTSIAIAAMLVRFNTNNFFSRSLASFKTGLFLQTNRFKRVRHVAQCTKYTVCTGTHSQIDRQTDTSSRHTQRSTRIISIWDGDEVKRWKRRQKGDQSI